MSTSNPCLKVIVKDMSPDQQLDEEDLKRVFSYFGSVSSVSMDENHHNQASICYSSVIAAYLALESLND